MAKVVKKMNGKNGKREGRRGRRQLCAPRCLAKRSASCRANVNIPLDAIEIHCQYRSASYVMPQADLGNVGSTKVCQTNYHTITM
jgi:hypothetical protein